jgi:3-phosphoshikimate 1-carboxyvinyltransferase
VAIALFESIESMRIIPARRITGRAKLPGDKSISHRAALVSALAKGRSTIANFSTSADCAATLSCLSLLGVAIEREVNDVRIEGVGKRGFSAPGKLLDCGNSGSTMRMIAGVLAGQNFTSVLTGDESLRSRPMERIIHPLRMMGARVESDNGHPPLRVEGRGSLSAIKYELPIASAQVKSCLLLAGLLVEGRTEVVEPLGLTRDHTERMLKWFGVPVDIGAQHSVAASCAIVGPASFNGGEVRIPGDFSSAAFLIAAAVLLPGSELVVEDVGLNPTRTHFLETLRWLGAEIEIADLREDCNEPVGRIRVHGKSPEADSDGSTNVIRGQLTASLVDELPLLAVIGTQMPGGIAIRDAAELRVKETDRIAATVKNLRAMGAAVEEFEDGLAVAGPLQLKGAHLDSYGDHRIAMAFSVAALLAEGESEIVGSECVAVSFPEFYDCLDSLVER